MKITDAQGYEITNEETPIYVVHLHAGGRFKITWLTAKEYNDSIRVYSCLITLSIIRGIFKDKSQAEEYYHECNNEAATESTKSFLNNLLI